MARQKAAPPHSHSFPAASLEIEYTPQGKKLGAGSIQMGAGEL